MADEPNPETSVQNTELPSPPSSPADVAPVGEGADTAGAAHPESPPQPADQEPATEEPGTEVPEPKPTDVPAAKPSVLSEGAKEPPAEEQKPPEEPAEAPHYEPFNLPDGFRVSEERMAPFTQFLGENKLTQEQGQALIDLHAAEVQRMQTDMEQTWRETFDRTREGWRAEFERDPELGGNRRQTTINSVVGLIRHFASDADHLRRTLQVLDFTGAGDHPDIIRLLANAARGMAQQYQEGAPVRAARPAPQPAPKYRQRYTASFNGSSSS